MAVLQMERLHVCAMKKERKKILELLQRRGVVEISDIEVEGDVFEKDNTSVARSLFLKNAETAEKALELLKKYAENQSGGGLSFLKGRTAIPLEVSDAFYNQKEDVLRTAQRILQLEREMVEAKAEVLRTEAQEEALAAWMGLPVPQTFTGTKKTAVFIGSLDGQYSLEELYSKLAEAAPELETVHIEIVSDTVELTSFFVVVLKKDAAETEETLRLLGFSRPASPSHHMPKEKQKRLLVQRAEAEKTIREAEEELASYGDRQDDIKFLQDHMNMRYEKYGMIDKLVQSKHVFILEGYIPQFAAQDLQEELNKNFECSAEVVPLAENEEAPVLLKNNKFAEPTESVLESYALPGREDVDPVGIMSIFYYIMFGLMFSDAGYGFVLALVTGFCLLKFKNMEYGWKKNIRMFFWCGISTIFWGIMFSSYFGDAFDAIALMFFGRDPSLGPVVPPLWFAPLESAQSPMWLLMFCLAVGVVHLTVGYIMKGIVCAKNKLYIDILYDSIFYIALIYPLILVLLGTEMFEGMVGFRLTLSSTIVNVCLGIAVVCMVGILFTGGRESKNWGKRMLKGAYALYNALAGWLSDILSYSRLLALGLATGVIGTVINQLGGMAGNGIVGFLVFVLVFVFGHTLNFGINILGSYVHSNRLEYVEFFGKFYEGGGRKFAPFGIHTKYYKIEEESQNV